MQNKSKVVADAYNYEIFGSSAWNHRFFWLTHIFSLGCTQRNCALNGELNCILKKVTQWQRHHYQSVETKNMCYRCLSILDNISLQPKSCTLWPNLKLSLYNEQLKSHVKLSNSKLPLLGYLEYKVAQIHNNNT